MKNSLPAPTEYAEQVAFAQWLSMKGYDFWHTPNQTFTKSWNQKRINKALGVQSGIPDLFVITKSGLVGVEMKRVKGGTVSSTQTEWIKKLNSAGIPTKVCKGAEQAIEYITSIDRS